MRPDALRPEEQIVVDEGCWGGEGTVVKRGLGPCPTRYTRYTGDGSKTSASTGRTKQRRENKFEKCKELN